MKRRINIFIYLIAGLLLTSCYNETWIPTDKTPSLGDDMAGLEIRLASVRTRADELFRILDGETSIRSVACFVRTRDQGKVGDQHYKKGGFYTFLITDDNNEITFNEEDGTYSISLQIKSQSFAGKSEVALLANYRENGLTDAVSRVTQWDDLFDLTSVPLTDKGIHPPLLMLGHKEVALTQSTYVKEEIRLIRLVARIDIVNKAANAPEKPFLLKSATLINPKTYTYIVEGNEEAFNIPVRPAENDTLVCNDDLRIDGLYAYEAANDGSVPHTALQIDGLFDGEPYTKRIELMRDGQMIPLTRNTRYQLLLQLTEEGTDIDWSVAVSEWSEGITIPVTPTFKRPEYDDVAFKNEEGETETQSFWDEETQTAHLDNLEEGYTITFVVHNIQETEPEVILLNGNWEDLGLATPEARARFISKIGMVIEEGEIMELYEITFPQKPIDEFEIEIRIENAAKPELYNTLRLLFAPDYSCELEELHFVNAAGDDVSLNTWNPTAHTCLIDHVGPGYAIWFRVRSIQGTDYYLNISLEDMAGLGIASIDEMVYKYKTEKEGIYTLEYYAVVFRQPPVGDIKAELRMYNSVNPDFYTYLRLDANHIVYPGTNTRAVRIGNLYWAPVNVGQTLLEASTPSTASTGHYFQWGRTKAFTQNPEPARVRGPVSLLAALSGTNRDQFVYGVSTAYDWLNTNSNEQYARNLLWSTPANTPCPEGWRLPTVAELIAFRDSRNGTVTGEHVKSRRYVAGDDGQWLYFPYMGSIRHNDGRANAAAIYRDIGLWAAEGTGQQKGYALRVNSDLSITVTAEYPATGYGVRCVRK
ncbi:uncharacterized protein (TIGR02145 family) [Parabacteroides sp. PFB2-10]|uniref:hypothetical protein n=1 Tax=Parabacteroides sp. PFB2-10 TaxID=1742405 RepID=UPI0024736246|nr:hypothetical protein [Parabacteroides sp. PFB2-10]MDH6312756.1 uncharacterized protein (TIGR02145 family) [Parabacteroides sp. PFB2-10]